jgi:hypothetical protein
MKLRPFSMIALLGAGSTFACASGTYDGTSKETGGTLGNAGSQTAPKGGLTGAGTGSTSGGSPGSGGSSSSSGGTDRGGSLSSGGTTSSSMGGTSASQGGSFASGGTLSSGGASLGGSSTNQGGATGGAAAGGKASNGGSGGTTGQGGNVARGGSGTGGSGTGGTPPVQCTAPQGTQGWTTRFWDCCKPSCSWPNNVGGRNPVKSCNQQNQTTGSSTQSACSGGGAYACWDMAPWAVSDTMAYGYAAFNGSQCGQCYELKFTGQSNSTANEAGSASLCGKTMIVQVINIGNITQGQFDLMIPGGGVGQFNACTNQWGVSGSALGEQYGGVQLTCQRQNNEIQARKTCTLNACNNLFKNSNQASLLAGCKWGVDWLGAADNPKVVYKQVSCPSELTSKSGLQ